MTAEPGVDAGAADNESTGLIKRIDAPLPPYAQPAPAGYAPPPPGNGAPLPPPKTMADAMVEVSTPPLAVDGPLLVKQPSPAPTAAVTPQPAAAPAPPVSTLKKTPAPAPTVAAPTVAAPVAAVALDPAPAPAPVEMAEMPVMAAPTAPTAPTAPASSVALAVPAPPMAQAATMVAAPAATTTTAVTMPPPATEFITCPECGTTASVTLNRRDSVDFCRNCDYPLFWTPSKIIRDPADSSDESLRRLPGTVGRATIASLACPFCYEPNALSAQTCVRCGKPMHPVVQAAPQPVYVPPPAPELPAPKAKIGWWVWAMLALTAAALIGLIVLIMTHTID